MKITNKNYNYGNNKDIFIVFDNISVYADHAIDKQVDNTFLSWQCRYLCPDF